MISTVTVSTVTTVTTLLANQVSLVVGAVAIAVLVTFLVVKELAIATQGLRAQTLTRSLNVAVVPLLFVFFFVMLMQIAAIITA